MRRNLSPALFPSWQATCKAFGAAISAGPGLVILVGAPGSGKTFTLLAFAGGVLGKRVSLRGIDEPVEPGTEIDLIDNVDAQALARLTAFEGTRAVAIRPNLVAAAMRAFPDARIVTVRPMSSRDVRVMVEVRRPQLGLPVGYFTTKALSRMDELCLCNPRQLDELLFLSLRMAAAAVTARVAPGHVERAALQLVMEQAADPHGSGSPDRETVLQMLHQVEAQRMKFGRESTPARAHAPSSPAFEPSARRGVQPSPARSTGRAAAKHEPPKRTPHTAAVLTIAGAPAPARDRRVPVPQRARLEQGGSRRRRTARASLALAAVAVVALVITVGDNPRSLSWLSGGGQSLADACPDAGSPRPAAAPSSTGAAVLAPTPEAARTAAALEPPRDAGLPELPPPPAPDVHAAQPLDTVVAAAAAPEAIETQHPAPTPEAAAPAPPEAARPAIPEAALPAPPEAAPPAAAEAAPPAAPDVALQPPEAPGGSVAPPAPVRSTAAAPTDGTRQPTAPPGPAPNAQAVAPPGATPQRTAPASTPEEPAGLASTARPRDAKEAARLLSLGKALFAINQIADAKEVMKSSAEMGNAEAAAFLAAYDAPSGPRRPQGRSVVQAEREGPRTRVPAGTAARRNRD